MTATFSLPRVKQSQRLPRRPPFAPKILDNKIVQGVATLTAGTAVGHLAAAGAATILTRLYTPEDFGVLAAFTAVVGLLTTLGCLGYERAIPVAAEEADALSLISLCGLILIVMTSIFAAAIVFLGPSLWDQAGAKFLEQYIWLAAPACFFISLYEALTYYATRVKAFAQLAWTKIYQGVGMAGCQLGWGLAFGGPAGLLLGDLAGRALGIASLGRPIITFLAVAPNAVSLSAIGRVAKRFWRFPAFTLPSTLLNRAAFYLPKLIMAGAFPPAFLGHLMLADWVLHAPASLLGQNLARVYIGEFSERRRNAPQTCKSFFRKFSIWLFVLALGPILAIYFLSPIVFPFIFGNNWEIAGLLARVLVPAIFLEFVLSPVSPTLFLSERQGLQLAWDIFYSLLVCGCVGAAAARGWEPAAIVGVYAAANVVAYLVQGVLLMFTMEQQAPPSLPCA